MRIALSTQVASLREESERLNEEVVRLDAEGGEARAQCERLAVPSTSYLCLSLIRPHQFREHGPIFNRKAEVPTSNLHITHNGVSNQISLAPGRLPHEVHRITD